MLRKTWNVRDQTDETLNDMLLNKYKEIEAAYKMMAKLANYKDAKKLLDEIWQMKNFANAIELELMRRDYYNGIS